MKIFFNSSSVSSCHLFLTSSACQIHTISFLYWAHLCMKCSLGISNFLEDISSLSHSIVFLHFFALRKAFLCLLAILWNSAFRCLYLSFSPLLFASLLFTAICKASSDSLFGFLHFFFLKMVLIPVSYAVSWNSSWTISDPKRWCCQSAAPNMPANLENSAAATELEKVSFHSIPKKVNAKEC